jgi:PPOX class probable F420-dependent enzyme
MTERRHRGSGMAERLEDERIQRFLATKEVVVLATIQADGSPLAMPVWFLHSVDALIMISQANTQKVRNLQRDPRVCVVAEAAGGLAGIRGVIFQGRAEFLLESDERRALARAFLKKYQPDLGRLWGGDVMPPDRVMFRIVPDRIRSWGLSA